MELHTASGVAVDASTNDAEARYLDRLNLAPEQRLLLLRDSGTSTAVGDRMSRLHAELSDHDAPPASNDNPAFASIHARLELGYADGAGINAKPLSKDVQGRERLATSPPLTRTSMVPRQWPPGMLKRWFGKLFGGADSKRAKALDADADAPHLSSTTPDPRKHTHRVAAARRLVLLGLTIAQTYVATNFMIAVLPYHGQQPLELPILVLFAILFGWVSAGFWTAIAGFALLLVGKDKFAITQSVASDAPLDPEARVAVVMPICNENVARVFAGLRATYESVERTGELAHFDFFVLSDTNDPDIRVAELDAWMALNRAIDGFGRVFYRWRQHRIKRKSGNIADFCRRWGANYRYMVVLDADSVMSGPCLTSLLRIIDANPTVGIVQTAPHAAGRETFYSRTQQWATSVYGPLFTAGLHFWQLGESHYWGHNAIIRVAPFMRYCALARLPGTGSLSGEILSHDFVEAALMRRAGWAVYIAYDLPGSYEEMPPNLIDELKRDRRWCQGNLMNFRLFMMHGLHIAHRAIFMSGVMAYLSALLWFISLLLSTALIAVHTLVAPTYFTQPHQFFPLWPEWHPEWAIALFSATAFLLFMPKLLSVFLIAVKDTRPYGGAARLTLSMVVEFVISALLAPIRMLFHSQFVLAAFSGWAIQWKSPPREDAETTWGEAFRRHGIHTLIGIAWASGVYWLNPSFLWWLLPIVGALILSIPISVYTSRITLGRRLRAASVFLIPEESDPPEEIRATMRLLDATPAPRDFVDSVVDPSLNALMCAVAVARFTQTASVRDEREHAVRVALLKGPAALSNAMKLRILSDPIALSRLHWQVWTSPDADAVWREALTRHQGVEQSHATAQTAPIPAVA